MSKPAANHEKLSCFQLLLLVLSIGVLGIQFVQTAFSLPQEIAKILDTSDNLICLLFLYDFAARFWQAEHKLAFMKWGWIDLLSSIPNLDFLRWGRAVRIIRVFRLLRTFRSAKVILGFAFRNRVQGTLASVALSGFVLVVLSAIAVLNFEVASQGNIRTGSDALWWAMSTITTVGYGDRYPVSTEGRIVAVILMVAGIGLFGVMTAAVASFFLQPDKTSNAQILQELRLIREKVEALETRVAESKTTGADELRRNLFS